ncbi:amidase signature domain-containing protein [Scheffersomyces amazonensis]|uniref:amidase signature domain-containing protein n=1 Tax=Scheffersomyces amazonensis TaxID=1078765 RepID=UPI00315C6F72
MLTDNWKDLAVIAQNIYKESLAKTLELFPFDDKETYDIYDSLPSAIGESTTDYGNPAEYPIEVYLAKLPAKVKEVTEKNPIELLSDLKSGKYTAVEVLKYYFHAAIFASKLTNCVQEFLPVESLAYAKNLDENFDKFSKIYPLFGLPISLKEMIPFTGRAVTHGSLCYLDRITDYNADIVNIMYKNGGNPFVRTTNPQVLMMLECESFAHGRTVNPFNSRLTSGGSSGGEGAINGIHASTVGFGSDIGGSIRCPSAFNGIYGMRTTVGRIPTSDYFSCQMGSESILSVTGPLTRSLDVLELIVKTIVDAKPWLTDPSLVSLEWRPETKQKFRLGIEWSDEVVNPLPPITRALNIVKQKLSAYHNIELVDFKPYNHSRTTEILGKLYFEDGARDVKKTLTSTGEPICEQTVWAIEGAEDLDIQEQWKWNLAKQKYRKEYLKHWQTFNNEEGEVLDGVIAPVFPNVAAEHRTAKYWSYTSQWNLLDYPVLVFPVSKLDETLDKPDPDYKPLNESDKYVHDLYDDPHKFANAPVNLGVVGLRYTEEKLIAIGKILREALQAEI